MTTNYALFYGANLNTKALCTFMALIWAILTLQNITKHNFTIEVPCHIQHCANHHADQPRPLQSGQNVGVRLAGSGRHAQPSVNCGPQHAQAVAGGRSLIAETGEECWPLPEQEEAVSFLNSCCGFSLSSTF